LLAIATSSVAQNLQPVSGGEVVEHQYYSLSYSEEHEQASWVFYKLTPQMVNGPVKRSDNFRPDPKVRTSSASLADYKSSGYDRGHLCPAGSMDANATAMSESFYMSNMSPQEPSFNRGIWKQLEEQVRDWTNIEGELYVVSGPVFKDNKGSIGGNKVTVPGYYYKVIYDPTDTKKMIAFLFPNQKADQDLNAYITSVDEVEKQTGIDFFSALSDEQEEKLEATVNVSSWQFDSPSKPSVKKTSSPKAHSTQCQGTTKAGTRCKRKAEAGSKYCWQHKK
jgi:endonuclease G